MKKLLFVLVLIFAIFLLQGCNSAADVASRNLSVDADNFKINRKIVFYNGITDSHILTIEGLCSLGNHDDEKEVTITCKVGQEGENSIYKKHFLGLSDNVTYFVEQIDAQPENTYHYSVILRPETLLPNIKLQTSNEK